MDRDARTRFSRHLLLPGLEEAGQARIMSARVLIIGLGGLGSIAAHYLRAAGVGHLTLVDGDVVADHNLPRQLLYKPTDIGQRKAICAQSSLRTQTDYGTIDAYPHFIEEEAQLVPLLQNHTWVLDCTDRFDTRYLINRCCLSSPCVLISAGIKHYQGYLAYFDHRQPDQACYACLFPEHLSAESHACQRHGVLSTAVGTLGTWQAQEVLKNAAGLSTEQSSWMLQMDFISMRSMKAGIEQDPACSVCGGCRISDLNR